MVFVQDIKQPPPPYAPHSTTTIIQPNVPFQTQVQATPNDMYPIANQPQAVSTLPSSRFPSVLSIHRTSISDLYLSSPQYPSQQLLYYVSTHGGFSSKPTLILHSGSHQSAPPIATSDTHSFSKTMDLTLYIGLPPAATSPYTSRLETHTSFMRREYSFTAPVPTPNNGQNMERFTWVSVTDSPQVSALENGEHIRTGKGRHCVRISTGEVVAAFARPPPMSMNHRGLIGFTTRARQELGEGVEALIVTSLLAVLDRERRRRAGAAAGAAGGGASC